MFYTLGRSKLQFVSKFSKECAIENTVSFMCHPVCEMKTNQLFRRNTDLCDEKLERHFSHRFSQRGPSVVY